MKDIVIKKLKPMFTSIVTTMDKYDDDILVDGLIDGTRKKGTIKEYQRVLAVGTVVQGIKEGDLVCINPQRYGITPICVRTCKGSCLRKMAFIIDFGWRCRTTRN